MNRNLLEREWIIPNLKAFLRLSEGINPKRNPLGYANELFGTLSLVMKRGDVEFIYEEMSPHAHFSFALMSLYEDRFAKLQSWVRKQAKADAVAIAKTAEDLKAKGDVRFASFGPRSVCRIALSQADEHWIANTRVPEYLSRQAQLLTEMLRDIEADVKNQRDILKDLIP